MVVNTLEEGGEPIFDIEGNIIGKTEPVHELVCNNIHRLIVSKAIKDVMKEYYFELEQIQKIWLCYLAMDSRDRGYITLKHLMEYMQEQKYSVVAPFLERFFYLIDKVHEEKATFEEFLPALCAYALFSRGELIAFFFNMLDEDKDTVLCKLELLKFAAKFRGGKKIPWTYNNMVIKM